MDSLPSPVSRDLIAQIVNSVYESLRKNQMSDYPTDSATQIVNSVDRDHALTDSDYPALPSVRNPRDSSNTPPSTVIPDFLNALRSGPSGVGSGEVRLQGGADNAAIRPSHGKAVIRPIKKGEFFSIPISEELFRDSARPFLEASYLLQR